MNKDIILINENDNVVTALRDLQKGERIEITTAGEKISLLVGESIESGHKLAVHPIKKGESVIKYGEVAGIATQNIEAGEHVHIHNVAGKRGRGDLQ
jgi:altronate dehydratase small subunit